MNIMTKAFLLSGSALASAGLFMTLSSAAMAQEATFVLPAGELGATSYNPITSSNLNSATSLIYDRLVEQDADQSFHPHLATSWEESPDGMTWVFKLHDGVKFHDGEPFNAETIAAWVPNFAGTENAFMVEAIDKVEVVDPLTVKFVMKRPEPNMLFNLASSFMGVPEPEILQGPRQGLSASPTAVGTGPFKLESFDDRARRPSSCATTTTPGPRSCRRTRAPAKIAKITFREIPDQSTAFLELKTGGVDVLLGVPTDFLSIIKAEKAATVITMPGTGINYMPINTSVAPFDRHQGQAGDRAGDQPEGHSRQRLQRHRPGGAQLPDQLAAGIQGQAGARHLLRPRQGRPAARRSRLEGSRRRHALQGRQAAQGQAVDPERHRVQAAHRGRAGAAQGRRHGRRDHRVRFQHDPRRVQEERATSSPCAATTGTMPTSSTGSSAASGSAIPTSRCGRTPKSDALNKIAMTGSKTSDGADRQFHAPITRTSCRSSCSCRSTSRPPTSPTTRRPCSVPAKVRGPRFRSQTILDMEVLP